MMTTERITQLRIVFISYAPTDQDLYERLRMHLRELLMRIDEPLHYAHQQNIVHRDLKPENILVNAQSETVLADFGVPIVLSTISTKQFADKHRDLRDQLHSHINDLHSSDVSDSFMGTGAAAFSGLLGSYVDTLEKHIQVLDSVTNAILTCHSSVMDATHIASHDDILRNGRDLTPKVIIEVTGPLNDMKNTASNFSPKEDFNHQQFLENIRTTFNNHVDVNLDLAVFRADASAKQAVRYLQIENEGIEQNEILCEWLAIELEDLLRRLFPKAESLIARQLPPLPSRSGTCVLSLQPFSPTGSGYAVVVKFGHFPRIKEEEHHFKEHVHPFVSGTRHTTIENHARTSLLGGIVYSLLETTNEKWIDFGQFYQQKQRIMSALNRLFYETCGFWYTNPSRWLLRNLSMDYCRQFGSSIEQLESSIKDTLSSVTPLNGQLYFAPLTESRLFTNPFPAINGLTFIYPTHEIITHGDLNQNHILIDNAEGIWLVDFENTEQSHILLNMATLDAVIRFQFPKAEESLLGIANFSQLKDVPSTFATMNLPLVKAYYTTCHLHTLARWVIDYTLSQDMDEYYVVLLYNALFTLQFFSLPTRQCEMEKVLQTYNQILHLGPNNLVAPIGKGNILYYLQQEDTFVLYKRDTHSRIEGLQFYLEEMREYVEWITVFMTHVYDRFSITLLEWTLQRAPLSEPVQLIRHDKLVKLLPLSSYAQRVHRSNDSIVHDRMDGLVTHYCWMGLDPDQRSCKDISGRIIDYYEHELVAHSDEQRTDYIVEFPYCHPYVDLDDRLKITLFNCIPIALQERYSQCLAVCRFISIQTHTKKLEQLPVQSFERKQPQTKTQEDLE